MDHIWRASQWSLQTERGNYICHSLYGESSFSVTRSAADEEAEWLDGCVDGIARAYESLEAAQAAVAADVARRDAAALLDAEVLAVDRRADVCSAISSGFGSECLEACR